MGKRIFLFVLTNILVVAAVTVILGLLNIGPYLNAYGINYQALLIICLVWGMAGSIISLMLSKMMAKWMMRLEVVDNNPQFRFLVQKVHRLAERAGIQKMPEVAIYQSPEINAFATGPSKNNSLVAVSTGLLNRMNDEEIEGVLGHEVAHIANGDMVTMALVQGVVNAFVMFLSRVVAFAIDNFLRNNDEEGQGLGYFAQYMVVMILQVIFGILAAPVVAWFSRYREFRADAGSAQIAGKHKMIAALEALKRDYEHLRTPKEEALKTFQISTKESFMQWFSTHPPLEKRIRALQYQTK